MSITVSNGFSICNSPLNTSQSKFMYSFPKEHRFRQLVASQSANVFYDLPSVRMKRSTAIGYGQKYDFTKQTTKTPAPNTYDQKTYTIESGEKRGWSFGLSRENMTKTSGPLGTLNLFSPGPGAYQVPNSLSKQSYTLRQKTESPDAKNTNLKSPGPGAYSVLPSINEDGKYFLSNYRSSGSVSFNPSSSSRFSKSSKDTVPGPGSYKSPESISNDGKYFISKFKSSNSRSFPHAKRTIETVGMLSAPGPGSYRLPSEFGYYQAKNHA